MQNSKIWYEAHHGLVGGERGREEERGRSPCSEEVCRLVGREGGFPVREERGESREGGGGEVVCLVPPVTR